MRRRGESHTGPSFRVLMQESQSPRARRARPLLLPKELRSTVLGRRPGATRAVVRPRVQRARISCRITNHRQRSRPKAPRSSSSRTASIAVASRAWQSHVNVGATDGHRRDLAAQFTAAGDGPVGWDSPSDDGAKRGCLHRNLRGSRYAVRA